MHKYNGFNLLSLYIAYIVTFFLYIFVGYLIFYYYENQTTIIKGIKELCRKKKRQEKREEPEPEEIGKFIISY
jgi:hypothetical protein